MKEAKYSAVGSSSSGSTSSSSSTSSTSSNAGNVVPRFWHPKLPAHFSAGLVTVAVVSFMVVLQIRDSVRSGLLDDIKRMIHPLDPPDEVEMPQHWNYSSHEFLPIISDWDEQRYRWIEGDPNLKLPEGSRPKVLVVTGSSQDEGDLYILSHLLLRAAKNKQDYTQMHDMELYYNMVNPDPEFSDWWVKLPVVRMLMLRHPEVEWIWWLDADAVITDMTYEPPFAKLDHYNLVLYGEDHLVHDNLDPRGLSTGSFMIRNCQWSLDLLGAWAYTGTDSKREEAGDAKFHDMEGNKTMEIVSGDDRSSLLALLAQDKRIPDGQQKWVSKVKLVEEAEYSLNGNWTVVGPMLEELSLDGDHVLPFITHFEGCLPNPSEVPELSRQDSENFNACVEQLERAFDFAENQVYKELGLGRNTIGNSSEPFIWKEAREEESTDTEVKILPMVVNWDQKRKAYLESKPWTKKDHALIVSGSPPTPCLESLGAHFLVRGFKNKIDYSRVHGVRIFHNMAVIHKSLRGWWSKLPVLKLMMANSINVEWIWWTDSDAVFTNMDFALPFDRYNANGYNLIMWGDDNEVFDLKKYNGINTGDMLIRNCQWSFDLLDRWASLSNITEDILLKFGLQRPLGWPADDQSVLVYLLLIEREKWASKVFFENGYLPENLVLSGDWMYWTGLFVDEYKMRADYRPFVTHFAGCHPCKTFPSSELCPERYDRALNFADNQVLINYGLRHERLNSSFITGDFMRDAQEWTHTEIERMVGKASDDVVAPEDGEVTIAKQEKKVEPNKEEVTTTKEAEEMTKTKEQVEETIGKEGEVATTEEEQLEPTKEQEEVTTTKKAKPTKEVEEMTKTKDQVEHTLSKEEEVATTKEAEQLEQTKEQEEVTTTKEKAKPTNEVEEMTKTKDQVEQTISKEEEVATPKGEEQLGPTKEELTTTKKKTKRTKKKAKPTKGAEEMTKTKEQMEETIGKKGEVATTNEEEQLGPNQEQEEVTTTNKKTKRTKEKAKPTKEAEEMTETKEQMEETISKEGEVATTKEEEQLGPNKEQEEVTTTNKKAKRTKEKAKPTKEAEEMTETKEQMEETISKEGEVATTKEEEQLEPTKEQEEVTITKEKAKPTKEKAPTEQNSKPTKQKGKPTKQKSKRTNHKSKPTKEQVAETTTKEGDKVGSTEEEVIKTKEDPKMEQEEVTTTKAEEAVDPTEQEGMTQSKEEERVNPTQEMSTTRLDEEMTKSRDEVDVDPSNEEVVDPTKMDSPTTTSFGWIQPDGLSQGGED